MKIAVLHDGHYRRASVASDNAAAGRALSASRIEPSVREC
jgi:hypothetical protein